MNRNGLGIVGVIVVVLVVVWLLGGTKMVCREGTFDKDKTVIEIKKD